MNRRLLTRSRALGIAVISTLTALVVFGEVAMAATFGGITGTSAGADGTVPASCDTNGVTASYATVWDATAGRYEISSVTIGGVSDTCDGKAMSVSLIDSARAQIVRAAWRSRRARRRLMS